MPQRIYDSAALEVREFVPLHDGEVSLYVCGPTVQSSPHVGHLRSALAYDIIRRWIEYTGSKVTLVRNVTDIDDKILAKATDAEPWWALAYRVELEFQRAYAALGILPPTYEPRATGAIPEMQALIAELIARGHAYAAPDGSGDVYFDTASWPEYGALTHQRIDDMEPAADGGARAKRSPHDFALWKGHKPGEPETAAWDSPWGRGRPGWHIECSAMSTKYLGSTFDIHGGGRDLRFPHHENELAQSHAAGLGFARYWMHNGLVALRGTKMSKSVGNIVGAEEFLGWTRPIVARYFLGSVHYRSTIELSKELVAEAEQAFARIEAFLDRSASVLEHSGAAEAGSGRVPDAFSKAMLDDFAAPQAIAVLHGTVSEGNRAVDDGDVPALARLRAETVAMLRVFGLDPESPPWAEGVPRGSAETDAHALAALVGSLVAERAAARRSKDFARADAIRETLDAAGVELRDGPQGTDWSVSE